MITVTKKDLVTLGYGPSFASDIIREAKKIMVEKGHRSEEHTSELQSQR